MTTIPFADFRPIGANFTRGGRRRIRGFVPHVQVGYGSLYGFFNRPKPRGQGASADLWCSKTGHLEEYVDLDDQAWAQGSAQHNGNPTFVSCEFEGYPNEPMTAQQVAVGGRVIAWLVTDVNPFALQVNDDPDNGEGITPHHVFGGGHTCPGPGPREEQFPDLIVAANRYLNHPTEAADVVPGQCRDIKGNKWHFVLDDNGHCFSFLNGKPNGPVLANDPGWTSGFSAECDPNGVIAVAGRDGTGQLSQIVFVPGGKPAIKNDIGGHIFPPA